MAEKKRRGHNEGSVYYVAARKRWVAEISLGPGKRKRYSFKSKQEALKKKNEALRELEQGILATGPQQKLEDYLENWIENVHKELVRLSTYVKYKKVIKYIKADLGHIYLQKLTPEQVQAFYRKKSKDGLASKTINSIHGVLHLALDNAVRWNYISRNVCDLVSPPRIVSREGTPLTFYQARSLVESVHDHRLKVLIVMAVTTGMRRGELLALRWSDIDFDRRILVVAHTVDYIPKYGYVESAPKTAKGKRSIRFPSFLNDMLRERHANLLEQKVRQGDNWEQRDLVFPDLRGGYFNPNYLLRVFKKILIEANIPHMHFHDLRHSAATILMGMGINLKVIQELLGHSDIAITLRLYSHLLPSMQQDVVDKWESEFEGKKNEEKKSDEENREQ